MTTKKMECGRVECECTVYRPASAGGGFCECGHVHEEETSSFEDALKNYGAKILVHANLEAKRYRLREEANAMQKSIDSASHDLREAEKVLRAFSLSEGT